jgi:hypothetical protein
MKFGISSPAAPDSPIRETVVELPNGSKASVLQ